MHAATVQYPLRGIRRSGWWDTAQSISRLGGHFGTETVSGTNRFSLKEGIFCCEGRTTPLRSSDVSNWSCRWQLFSLKPPLHHLDTLLLELRPCQSRRENQLFWVPLRIWKYTPNLTNTLFLVLSCVHRKDIQNTISTPLQLHLNRNIQHENRTAQSRSTVSLQRQCQTYSVSRHTV